MRNPLCAVMMAGIFLSAAGAYGWNVPLAEAHLIGSSLLKTSEGFAAGDFDGDGDPDVVIETTLTNLVWLKNVNAATSNWVGAVISSGSNDLPLAVADFDNDGDPDVLTFADPIAGEAFQWYENSASGTVWAAHVLDNNLPFGAQVGAYALGDFDRDGSLDFVVRFQNSNIPLYWYANTGTGLWTRYEAAGTTNRSLAVADVDRDGDPDITRMSGSRLLWLENVPGVTSNWTSHVITTNTQSAYSHTMLDVDQDGDVDAVTLGYSAGWYENTGTGTGTGWTFHAVSAFTQSDRAAHLDLDQDGDEDVIGDDDWFENPGRLPGAWARHSLTNIAPGSLYAAGFGDVDRDGDVDILNVSTSNRLSWLEVAQTAPPLTFSSARTIATNVTDTSDLVAADLDRDGDVDVVASSYGSGLLWFQSGGPGTSWTRRVISTNGADYSAVAVGDLDSDGDPDVAASVYSSGDVLWFRNLDGQGGSWQTNTIATAMFNIFDLDAAPINGDPFPDLAGTVGFNDYAMTWINRDGSATNWLQKFVTNNIPSPYALDFGDVDRDGDLDIVATESTGSRLRWFRNPLNNAGTNWAGRIITTNSPGYAGVALADLDGDGDVDVAAVSVQTDSLDLWINTSGDGSTWTNYSVIASFTNPVNVIAGDFNHDGRVDLATAEASDNRASVFYNLGGYSVWLRRNLATAFTGTLALAAADFNDDGDLDLATAASYGSAIVWFEKDGVTDLRITKRASSSSVPHDAPVSFTLTVTNYGPQLASSVVVTDTMPAEITWTNDTAGAGPPVGSNLTWAVGTLAPGQSATCIVFGITASGFGEFVVTNRASVAYDGALAVASNATAVVTIGDLTGTIATNFDGASDVALADFDRDGWLDVVACASNANLIAGYRNRGRGTNWTAYTISSAFTNPTRLVVADFDRDGDLDTAAISPKTGRVSWWDNFITQSPAIAIATGQFGIVSIEAADMDRDGDTDLLACVTGTTSVLWFQNGGGPATNWTLRTVSASAGSVRDATAVDLDRDGDPDVVAINQSGQVGRFMNLDGTGTSWSAAAIGSGSSGGSAITTADFDGDGDADVAAVWGQTGQIEFWENADGAGGSWTQRVDSLFLAGVSDIAAADWDGDGDQDIVASGRFANAVKWWENLDRRGQHWAEHEVYPFANGANAIALGDINRDGSLDFVSPLSTADRIYWGPGEPYPWPGTISDGHRFVFITNWNEVGSLTLFDADADGDLDVAAFSRSNKTIRLWRNLDRAGTRWSTTNVVTTQGYMNRLYHADMDRDGDEDLVSNSDLGNSGVWWWENAGGIGNVWTQHFVCGGDVFFIGEQMVISDLDRDGDPDIAGTGGFSTNSFVYWFRNEDGVAGTWTTNLVSLNCTNAQAIAAGDLDHDGDTDLAVGGGTVYLLENTGGGTNWTYHAPALGGLSASAVRIGDLDHDGTNDILYADGSQFRLLRIFGALTNTTTTLLANGLSFMEDVHAADMDADGDLDLIASSASYAGGTNRVIVVENVTTSTTLQFVRAANAALDTVGSHNLAVGDIDGDGDPDIAASFHTTPAYGTPPDLAWWQNRAVSSLAIDKNVSPLAIGGPTSVTWTVTVSNGLPVTASNVTVTDWLPPNATWVSDTCGVGAPGTNAWVWNVGTLAAGATVSCTITALVAASTAELVNHARVTSDDATSELDTAVATSSDPDFDLDGLPNSIDPDDDNDGMPDIWEILYSLNPLNASDAAADGDLDGYSNLDEYIAMTSPANGLDYFRLTGIGITGSVAVTYGPSSTGRLYTLEYTVSLSGTAWTQAPGQINIPGGAGILTNTATTGRFHRVRVRMP